MSCYDPIYASVCTRSDGSRYTRLGLQSGITFRSDGRPVSDIVSYPDGSSGYVVKLPCGHCLGCRSDQAKTWSNRLMLESLYHDSAYFVTLTYDEVHVPRQVDITEYGEYIENLSLRKKDVQNFHKRLRKAFPNDKIRFYLAGEYGEHTERPHYHAIYFGLHPTDLQPFGMSETGNQYFISDQLQKIWNLGFVSIEPANEFTFKYVANYVTKKLGVHFNDYYNKLNIEPPFSLSSRRPGIGLQYYIDHECEILENDRIVFGTDNASYNFRPPRYFYKKAEESGVDLSASKRFKRYAANDHDHGVDYQTDLLSLEQLEVQEYNHAHKIKSRSKL